jgi:catechol 2,3-dioxygenase-like lactoylglutathione lyase family enzyme
MEQAVPILLADDLSVAKAFYVDGLGFSVTFETSEDGRTGLLGLQRGTIRLTIDSPMSGHGRNACVSLDVRGCLLPRVESQGCGAVTHDKNSSARDDVL